MKNVQTLVAVALVAILSGSVRAEQVYNSDPTHASIGFSVPHLVISKVKGSFTDFSASLKTDDSGKLTAASAVIKVDSISTANEDRDKHLKSADFFDSASFPEIRFESTAVEGSGEDYSLKGNLTIRDITKEVVLPAKVRGPVQDPWGNTKIGFETSITIDRTQYGLTWSKALETGGLVVGNEVDIHVDLEFALQKAE